MICYQITNLVTGKVYVGLTTQSLSERWRKHCVSSKKSEAPLYRAIRKYGIENFIIEEIACALGDLNSLKELEKDLIAQNDCIAPKGYNATKGGDGVSGCEETSKKISKSLAGKKLSVEHIESLRQGAKNRKSPPCSKEKALKISLAQKGKPRKKHSQETKEKCRLAGLKRKSIPLSLESRKIVSESNKTRVVSKETREKMSASRKGKKLSQETIAKIVASNKRFYEAKKQAQLLINSISLDITSGVENG